MPAPPSVRLRPTPRGAARAILILAAAGLALWVSLATTVAAVLRQASPETALAWWGANAEAHSLMAAQILQGPPSAGPRPAQLDRARAEAELALRREPVNVGASRTLALIAGLSGDQRKADRLLAYAEALSRRDLATEIMLIERKVQANDIPGALEHYDRALRTSPESRDLLLPILVGASADPAIARPIARLLARRPTWRVSFAELLTTQSQAPRTMAYLMLGLHLDPQDEREHAALELGLRRLGEAGDYQDAWNVYAQARARAAGARGGIRNGDFEADTFGLTPFDWSFVDEPELAAIRQAGDEAQLGFVLSLVSENGRNGEVARQMLLLAPGAYRLSALVGNVTGDALSRPLLSLSCATGGRAALGQLEFPVAAPTGVPLEGHIQVPASGCAAQWLTISLRSGLGGAPTTPWIDSIALSRR